MTNSETDHGEQPTSRVIDDGYQPKQGKITKFADCLPSGTRIAVSNE